MTKGDYNRADKPLTRGEKLEASQPLRRPASAAGNFGVAVRNRSQTKNEPPRFFSRRLASCHENCESSDYGSQIADPNSSSHISDLGLQIFKFRSHGFAITHLPAPAIRVHSDPGNANSAAPTEPLPTASPESGRRNDHTYRNRLLRFYTTPRRSIPATDDHSSTSTSVILWCKHLPPCPPG